MKKILNHKNNIFSAILYLLFVGVFGLAVLYIIRERMSGAEKFFGIGLYLFIFIVIYIFVMGFYDEKE